MKGAIFDLDGTLIDSMNVWNNATSEFYRKKGLVLTDQDFNFYKSSSLDESMPYLKRNYKLKESVEDLTQEFNKIMFDKYALTIPMKPYAKEYLIKLKSDGVKLAIATSTRPYFSEAVLKRHGIFDLFDAFAYSEEVGVNKTNPDVYLLAAKRMNVPPENCTVYEDILVGIKTVNAAGMKSCAIFDSSNADETEELKKNAHIYIESWENLLK